MSSNPTRPTSKLHDLRNAAGLSQRELAKLSGIARDTIVSIEGGRCVPRAGTAKKLLAVLNKELKTKLRNWDVFPDVFKDPADIIVKKEQKND